MDHRLDPAHSPIPVLVTDLTGNWLCRYQGLVHGWLRHDHGQASNRLCQREKFIAREVERDRTTRQVQFSATAQYQLHGTILTQDLIHTGHSLSSIEDCITLDADNFPV